MNIVRETGQAALGGATMLASTKLGLIDTGWDIVAIGLGTWFVCSVIRAYLEAQHD